ncbi:hypothetical protein ABZ769_31975 [Streptomyces olivoreticuli]
MTHRRVGLGTGYPWQRLAGEARIRLLLGGQRVPTKALGAAVADRHGGAVQHSDRSNSTASAALRALRPVASSVRPALFALYGRG